MDRFAALSLFARVVETGSFSAAAREAAISQPTASKQIAELEHHLGARLIQRTTRRLNLTEAGAEFYDHAKRLLADLAEAEAGIGRLQGSPVGTLRIGAPVAFGRLHIMPVLVEFMKRHPGLGVDLALNDHFVDLVEERVDVAIRIGRLGDTALIARHLGYSPRVLAATPGYFESRGVPETLGALKDHDCIVYRYLTTGNEWRFTGPSGEIAIRVDGHFSTNSSEGVRAAVLSGMGIGLVPTWLVADALRTGELVAVLPAFRPSPMDISALYPPTSHVPAKVRLFIDFLRQHMRQHSLFA